MIDTRTDHQVGPYKNAHLIELSTDHQHDENDQIFTYKSSKGIIGYNSVLCAVCSMRCALFTLHYCSTSSLYTDRTMCIHYLNAIADKLNRIKKNG